MSLNACQLDDAISRGISPLTQAATPHTSARGLADIAYRAPLEDIFDALDVAGLEGLLALSAFDHVDRETVEHALSEFGRFASDVIAPTDGIGDRDGCQLDVPAAQVSVAPAVRRAYRQYVESGWGALPFPLEYGGGAFPSLVGIALQEMFASANVALSLNGILTQGGIELLMAWGDEAHKALYLPKLLTGEWCGTMNLTEPEAGSDLGEVRTQAVPEGDGTWRISGTKIFITWGEHDAAENIIHLVLARTPDAPAGTRGLSLFLVPKVLVDQDGGLGDRNSVRCIGLEHKLGIHSSPTCVMEFDEARGELVGPEHGGMAAMFTMMNAARLSIGLQGPSIAERAFQHAFSFAQSRMQGRGPGVVPPARSALTQHPDVQRMLLSMRTTTLASRLLLYVATGYRDLANHASSPEVRASAQGYVDLLTPVAKAWSTDMGVQSASVGIQVLGGMGYIEESGMAQRLRDARIGPIYEGTNGIQALDLVTRKLPMQDGEPVRSLLEEMRKHAANRPLGDILGPSYRVLSASVELLGEATDWLLKALTASRADAAAGATAFLELMGTTVGTWLHCRRAEQVSAADPDRAGTASGEANYFATELASRSLGLGEAIMSGADRLAVLADLRVDPS
jgi:alkylation response protein AidB-like acyl-CoA dehydrogenase